MDYYTRYQGIYPPGTGNIKPDPPGSGFPGLIGLPLGNNFSTELGKCPEKGGAKIVSTSYRTFYGAHPF
jgi:hypothetical protein